MAIRLEFINIIFTIENIDKCYPGGFNAFVSHNRSKFGGKMWHDDYLFKDGVMDPNGIEDIIVFWEEKGLKAYEERNGKTYWKDICVIYNHLGTTHTCDWLEEDVTDGSVYLKGKPKGRVIGREEMKSIMA